jgi:hypothetical protein
MTQRVASGVRCMTAPIPSITIRFGDEVGAVTRARMTYVLRVFASIYGYVWGEPGDSAVTVACVYGRAHSAKAPATEFRIPARYRSRSAGEKSPAGSAIPYAEEKLVLFHGVETVDSLRRPDWLGEIFEWLTASHELGADTRDEVGRIPFAASVFGNQRLSPTMPYAAMLMAWMQNAIACQQSGGPEVEALPPAQSCSRDADHFVVSSHDIDFYWVGRASAFVRTAKNLAIARRLYRSREYFESNSRFTLDLLGGRRVGDFLPQLLYKAEHEDFQSTLFVVARRGHRRDPKYRIEDLRVRLDEAKERGFEIALHGSYCSVIEELDLASEKATLSRMTGVKVRGARQHWLRFDQHRKLFGAVADAGLVFDSTLGFSDAVGFRNGASFAFPPYCFETEKPYNFLEIPLVLMDGAIEAVSRSTGDNPFAVTSSVLNASRKWGWGGVAALWHNPIEPLSVPQEINEVFWTCVSEKERFRERWISASEFMKRSLSRYQSAGLLAGVNAGA